MTQTRRQPRDSVTEPAPRRRARGRTGSSRPVSVLGGAFRGAISSGYSSRASSSSSSFSPVIFWRPHAQHGRQQYGGNQWLRTVSGRAEPDHSIRLSGSIQGRHAWQAEPWAEVAHRAYADGELPLWNPVPRGRRAPCGEHVERCIRSAPARRQPAPDPADLGPLHPRCLRLGRGGRIPVRTRPRPSGGSGGRQQRRVLPERLVLPVQQQPVQPVVRLPAAALSPGGAHTAHSTLVARPRARRRHRRKHLRRDARGVVLRDWRRCGVRGGSPSAAAPRDARPRLARSTRRRGCLLGLLLAAPILLLFLQYESLSFNVHKPEFASGSECDPHSGLLQLDGPVLFRSTRLRRRRQELDRGRASGSRPSPRSRVARRRSDSMPGCSSLSASSSSPRSTGLALSSGSAGCRSRRQVVFPVFARPSSRSRSQCWRGSAFTCSGIVTSDLRRFPDTPRVVVRTVRRLLAHRGSLVGDHERAP